MALELEDISCMDEIRLYAELRSVLPNTNSFNALRTNGKIYVDKTALLYPIARDHSGAFYLTRPPRFGKSTQLSTLEELFRYGLEPHDGHDSCFKGLAIEHHWKEPGSRCQVLRLDFADRFAGGTGSAAAFDCWLTRHIREFTEDAKLEVGTVGDAGDASPLSLLQAVLEQAEDNSIVLLIDNFDTPLLSPASKPDELHTVRETLRTFYALVKRFAAKFRLIFMTGLTRCKDYLSLSIGNFSTALSLHERYAALCGFTKEELLKNFRAHLICRAAHLKGKRPADVCLTDINHLLDTLTSWYGGYAFGNLAQCRVFAPCSVLQFFTKGEAQLTVSAGLHFAPESFLKEKLLSSNLQSLTAALCHDEAQLPDSAFAAGADTVEQLEVLALLGHLGFLTINAPLTGGSIKLTQPNEKMRQLLLCVIDSFVMQNYQEQPGLLYTHQDLLLEAVRNADADTVSDCLSTVLRPIQRGCPALISKSQLLTLLGHFMQGCAFKQKVSANPLGCGPDLCVEPDDCSSTQLFKFTLSRTGHDINSLS